MSWRKNPNPTIKPPFGSYIDWSHPLADGLLYCCILNEYTGRPSDMVNGRIAIENTMQWSGESLEGADAQYCNIQKNPDIDSVSEYTIVSDGEFYDTTDGCLFCHTSANNSYRPAIGIARIYSGESIKLSCCSDTANNIYTDISNELKGHYAGRRSANIIDTYFNGDFVNSIASDGGALLLDNTCVAFGGFGQYTSISNRFLTGKAKYGLLWGRLLTPDEIAWQYAEPYVFISWPSRRVIFDFGSASGIKLLGDIHAVSGTSDPSQSIARLLLGDITAASISTDILSSMSRSLFADIAQKSSTSGVGATLLWEILAQIAGAADTSAPSANLLRELTADIPSVSSTSDPSAESARQLLADIQAIGNVGDITAALSGVISLVASISGVSSTADADAAIIRTLLTAINTESLAGDVLANVARLLLADISEVSDTSDITATLQKIISLTANIDSTSATNDTYASVARAILAAINADSGSTDALGNISRSLLTDIAVASDMSDITASLQNIIALAAAITGVSLTSNTAADMARSLSALIAPQFDAGGITASVARSLLADITGTSVTPDDLIMVLSGLGLIIDPEIESLTPVRTLESITKKRTIVST